MSQIDDEPTADELAQFAPKGSPAAAAVPSQADDEPTADELKAFTSASATPHVHTSPIGQPVTPNAPPTRFQQSTAPSTEPEQSWGDTLTSAGHNLLPSVGGVLKATGNAALHPLDTLNAIGDVGKGAVSQAAGALGFQQDPVEKKKTEALLDALEDHYKTAYGSIPGFKKALATDPASVAMDASSVIGGAGMGAKAAGLAGTANVLGKAGAILDPVNDAIQVAKFAGKPVTNMVRGAQGLSTGAGGEAMRLAGAAGATNDASLRNAYQSYHSGNANPQELQGVAQSALEKIEDDHEQKYISGLGALGNQPVNVQPIQDAIDARRARLGMGAGATVGNPDATAALDRVQKMLDVVKADPARQTIPHIDALKKQIRGVRNDVPAGEAQNSVDSIYTAARDSIATTDPNYLKVMQQSQLDRANVNDLVKTLGLGDKTASTQAAIKLMRAGKKNTIGGAGKPLLDQLADKDPRIPYMLAGLATRDWTANGLRGVGEGLGVPLAVLHPGALPSVLGSAAAMSPKLNAKLNYAAGKLSKAGAAQSLTKPAYYAGRADEQQQAGPQQPPDPVFNQMLQQESGNRQTDKKGMPMTSPKGAIGAAQVMPSTGPEAAKLAGETWDPQRLATDGDYNRRLGHAYYNSLKSRYDDPYVAAAAYNAGPDRIDRALEQQKRTSTSYLNYVPWETRQYVQNLQSRTTSATGGRITRAGGGRVDHTALVNRLMTRWKAVKRSTDQSTEGLLKVPDNAIMHALKVADKAI